MPATALLTSEQYLALPDEFDKNGNHVKDELIGGEVVKVPPSSQLHNLIKINIIGVLVQYERGHQKLKVKVLAEMAFIVTPQDTFCSRCKRYIEEPFEPEKAQVHHGCAGIGHRSCFSDRQSNTPQEQG